MSNFHKNHGRIFTALGDGLNIECERWKVARKTFTLQTENGQMDFCSSL